MSNSSSSTGPLPRQPIHPNGSAAPRQRRWLPFVGGVVVGLFGIPVVAVVLLALLGGTNAARQPTDPPSNQPDLSILVSKSYMERSLANNPQFRNPVIILGNHPQGGAALTLTMGIRLPLVGVQDIQTRSQVLAQNNKLVVITQQAGLGDNGRVRIPGNLVERAISELMTDEIEKRLQSNPSIVVDIVRVAAKTDALQVDAALRQAGK